MNEETTLTVRVHTQFGAAPIEYENVIDAYEKGAFFCVAFQEEDDEDDVTRIHKYPIASIFRVEQIESAA